MPTRSPLHRPAWDTQERRDRQAVLRRKQYDKSRRFDPFHAFYNSKEWRSLRARFIRAYPVCVHCGHMANQVDHIHPIRQNWDRRLDLTNLQPLCQSCHSRKTRLEASNS